MANLGGTWHNWTADEQEFILKNYKTLSYSEMAVSLGMTKDMVKGMGRKLGLTGAKFSDEKKKRISQARKELLIKHNKNKKTDYIVQKRILMGALKNIITDYPEIKNEIISEISNL
jgi:hypothetical protein